MSEVVAGTGAPVTALSERVVARNFMALGAGEAISRLVAFAATVYIARSLGPSLFGAIGVAAAVLLYFNRLVDGGLELGLGVREVAADPASLERLVPPALTARIAVGIGLALILAVVGTLWLPQPEGALLALYGLTLVPAGASTRWVHLGFDRSRLVAVAATVGQIVMAGLVVLLVRLPADAGWVPAAQFTGDTLAALLMLGWFWRRGIRFSVRIDAGVLRPLLPRAAALVGSALLGLWIYNSDLIFLRLFHDREVVGWYGAAYTITTFFLNLGAAFGLSLLPSLTRLNADPVSQRELYHSGLARAFAASLPIAVGGALLAMRGMALIFGPRFGPSGVVFLVLAWCIPACVLRDVTIAALMARGRERVVLRLTFIAAVINLALNILLIPAYGAVGAAVASVATEVARMVIAMASLRREAVTLPGLRRFWRPVAAGGGMTLVLILLPPLSPPTAVAIGALTYATGLVLLGGLRLRWGQLPVLTV